MDSCLIHVDPTIDQRMCSNKRVASGARGVGVSSPRRTTQEAKNAALGMATCADRMADWSYCMEKDLAVLGADESGLLQIAAFGGQAYKFIGTH